MKQLILGNEAVARGLYEAGCSFVSSYPGTPSTEITEAIAKYPEVYAEWAPNEKVAMESAFGASLACTDEIFIECHEMILSAQTYSPGTDFIGLR